MCNGDRISRIPSCTNLFSPLRLFSVASGNTAWMIMGKSRTITVWYHMRIIVVDLLPVLAHSEPLDSKGDEESLCAIL